MPRDVFGIRSWAAFPVGARIDTWVEEGSIISPFYDPLLTKVIVKGPDRAATLEALGRALDATRLDSIETHLEFLRAACRSAAFREGRMTTRFLAGFTCPSLTVDVLQPGAQTTVQE